MKNVIIRICSWCLLVFVLLLEATCFTAAPPPWGWVGAGVPAIIKYLLDIDRVVPTF